MSFLITQTESSSPPPTADNGPFFEVFFFPLPEENLNNLGSSLAFLFSIVRGMGMFLLITLSTRVFLLTFWIKLVKCTSDLCSPPQGPVPVRLSRFRQRTSCHCRVIYLQQGRQDFPQGICLLFFGQRHPGSGCLSLVRWDQCLNHPQAHLPHLTRRIICLEIETVKFAVQIQIRSTNSKNFTVGNRFGNKVQTILWNIGT